MTLYNNNAQKLKANVKDLVSRERVKEVENFFEMAREFPHLCTSCGMCDGVCPTEAIGMEMNEYAQFVPKFIQENCIYCKKCILCCPGIDITGSAEDIGEFKEIYLGHANQKTYRSRGASGGVITALSAWMLEKGIIEKSISLNSKKSPIVPEIVINTSAKEVAECSGSKYVSTPICSEIKEFDSKSSITVLPCQSIAMKKMRKTQGYIFGVFCSGAQTKDLVEYVSQKEDIKLEDIKDINYRVGDWPGNILIHTSKKDITIPYRRSYYTAAANSGYFTIQGCALCPDYFNENADISFGDPWGISHGADMALGKTLMIVRTQKGTELLQKAQEEGIITLEKVTKQEVLSGHRKSIYFKKKTLYIRVKKIKDMGLPLPRHKENISKRFNIFDHVVHEYVLRNIITMKKKYKQILNYSKYWIFIERFFVHTIHTLYLKILWASSKK
jgi:coenzyme F420 hydrogenase subunit beta